jgi:hypothetical protein
MRKLFAKMFEMSGKFLGYSRGGVVGGSYPINEQYVMPTASDYAEAKARIEGYQTGYAAQKQAERAALVAEIAAAVVKAIADKEQAQRTGDVAVLQAMLGKVVKP